MKKTLLLLFFTIMNNAFATTYPMNTCELGQRCQIPIYYKYGDYFVGLANIVLPTPSLSAPALGNFQCTFQSSNLAQVNQLHISVTTYTNNIYNLAIIAPNNNLLLNDNTSQAFIINWEKPNMSHKGASDVMITSGHTLPSAIVSVNTKLYLTCVKTNS